MKTPLRVNRDACSDHSAPERKLFDSRPILTLARFLGTYRPALLILSGPSTGIKVALDQARTTLGRGPGVDLAIDDPSLLGETAAIEFNGRGLSLSSSRFSRPAALHRPARELGDGDRFRVGKQHFQFCLRLREQGR